MQYHENDKVKQMGGFKPCPFCHSDDLKADGDTLTFDRTMGVYEQNGKANIVCQNCKCFFTFPTKKEISLTKHLHMLKKQWNNRD